MQARNRTYCLYLLYTLITIGASVWGREIAYESVSEQLEQGEAPQLQEGDQVTMESLRLREKLERTIRFPLPKQIDPVINEIGNKALSKVDIKQNVLPENEFEQSFSIAGTIKVNLFDQLRGEVSLRVIGAHKDGTWQTSVELNLPKNWKMRDMLPQLKNSPVGSVPLPDGQLIFSTFKYTDDEGYEIAPGANIAAHVSLEEVSPDLYRAVNKLRPKNSGFGQSVVFEGFDKVRLNANIGRAITETGFDMTIPLRIGVDFDELYKQNVIKRKPSGIRKITTGNMVARFVGGDQAGSVETGLQVFTTTQKDPLDLRGRVDVSPHVVTIIGKMDGVWDPAVTDWLAINNPAFEINFDYQLMSELLAAGVPIPFTGLKIRGGMGIGKDDMRTTVKVAGGVEISQDPQDLDFLITGNIDQIRLKQFLDLFSRITKKPEPKGKIPEMSLRDVKLYVVPKDMAVAGEQYEAGIEFGGGVQIDKFRGDSNFVIDTQERRITAEGTLEPLRVGKVFEITGKGADNQLGTDDDVSRLGFTYPPQGDQQSFFTIDGVVRIPPLKIENTTTLKLSGDRATFDLQQSIAGTGMQVSGDVSIKNPADTMLDVKVEPNVLQKIVKSANKHVQKRRQKVQNQIDALRQKIEKAKREYREKIEKERKRIEQEMQQKRKEYEQAKAACKSVNPIKRPFKKACLKRAKLRLEMLAKEKIYKDFLLKKGEKAGELMSVPGELAKQVQTFEKQLNVIDAVADKLARIKSISTQVSVEALKKGDMPQLDVIFEDGTTFSVDFAPDKIVKSVVKKAMGKLKPSI